MFDLNNRAIYIMYRVLCIGSKLWKFILGLIDSNDRSGMLDLGIFETPSVGGVTH